MVSQTVFEFECVFHTEEVDLCRGMFNVIWIGTRFETPFVQYK